MATEKRYEKGASGEESEERQTFIASRAWVFLVLKESEIYVARKARSGAKSSYLVPQSKFSERELLTMRLSQGPKL